LSFKYIYQNTEKLEHSNCWMYCTNVVAN